MHTMRLLGIVIVASSLVSFACSSSSGGGAVGRCDGPCADADPPANGGDAAPDDDGPEPAPDATDDGAAPVVPGSFDVAKMCQSMIAKAPPCGIGATQAACERALREAAGRGCAGLLPALAAHLEASPTPFTCTAGAPSLAADAPEGAFVANACLSAVMDEDCYALSCKSFRDCPTDWSCNDVTAKCYRSDASCVGLPCKTFRDCPTGNSCNTALGVCIPS
jgi:hypothetical protein